MGIVIFLNGASSSGKTSIARELQKRWDGPLLLFGIDDVISMMPFKYTGDEERAREGFLVRAASDPEAFVPGPYGYRLNELVAEFVGKLAAEDFDVVVDYVLNEKLLESFQHHLARTNVLFCGVLCDLHELTSREQRRSDRAVGLAVRQAADVHFCRQRYDLELDSTSTPASELADRILKHLASQRPSRGLGA